MMPQRGPVSAAAMCAQAVPALDPFRSQHCTEEEYGASLRAVGRKQAFVYLRLSERRRFVQLWPNLEDWLRAPLVQRMGRLHGQTRRTLSCPATYHARSYLYYLALRGHLRLDLPWLFAVGDLTATMVAQPLGIDFGCAALTDEAVQLGLSRASTQLGFRWLLPRRLLSGSGVVTGPSRNQACDKGAEQGFAAPARVVHELEEAEIERQLLLRDASVRAQPGSQQGPEALHRVDVDLAEAVAVLVAGILAAPMADRLVLVAPSRQALIDGILVGVDEGARGDGGADDRLDRCLLHVGQHVQHDLATALDQAENGWLVLLQRAAARRACQPATTSEPPLLATAAGWPLCPATT